LAAINANTPSVTVKHLSSRTIGEIGLPLPPRAEQTRIVAKLEELLSDLDAGVAELKSAQKKLTQYRQSLLKSAVEGALTAEWRASLPPLSPSGRGVGGEGLRGAGREGSPPWLTQRAKTLRREQTPAEQSLWQHLRAKRFSGYKFRRQQPIGRYVVDFVCFARKLVVELDGSQHAERVAYDQARDAWLRSQGFRVLRFWNNEWTGQKEAVLEGIWRGLEEGALANTSGLSVPSPLTPLPQGERGTRGEGLERETGEELLRRILVERRARWEEKQLARFKEQGKAPPLGWQQKYPEPVPPDTTGLAELPEGWVWATLSQVGWLDRGKSQFRPRNAPHLFGGPYPFVQTGDIRHADTFISRVDATYSEDGLSQSRLWPAGTMCITIAANIGKTAILAIDACFPDSVVGFRAATGDVSVRFVEYFMRSAQQKLEEEAPATAQKNINLETLARVVCPVPPRFEQDEIVARLDEYFSSVRETNEAIDLALKQSTAQRQNILRAAFSGELVPQDPNDEPASVLLERIRAERAARAGDKKTRGRPARKAG
jgi:very-short-patch-repair endonuclease